MKRFVGAAGAAVLLAASAAGVYAQVRTIGPARPVMAAAPVINIPPLAEAQPIEFRSSAPAVPARAPLEDAASQPDAAPEAAAR